MKKIVNAPERYTDEMLEGIYAAHGDQVRCANNDLRCYCTVKRHPGKVSIVTGGGTGHLPLFLGYVGEGLLDGCGVGSVFQPPSAEQIFEVSREVDTGAGVLFLFGNYSLDALHFQMAAEMCELEGIETRTIAGTDDVPSGGPEARRGVAGLFFLYKAAGARAAQMGTLQEVCDAAQKAKDNTRTVGFALTPCVIPELGRAKFDLGENEMAIGMGIHGEPGTRTTALKTSSEVARESLELLLNDMPVAPGEEIALMINGLGATSVEELYILCRDVIALLKARKIGVYRSFVGEYATSLEMAGASVSICKLDDELRAWLDYPVCTPFYTQM